MNTEEINSFFSKWQKLPASGDECLPHQYLVDVSQGRGKAKWNEHLHACEQCSEIVKLLQNRMTRPQVVMAEFIMQKKEQAAVASAVRRQTLWRYLKALFSVNQPRWNTAVLSTCVLLLIGFGSLGIWQMREQKLQPGVAQLERDELFYAAETIRVKTDELSTITLSGSQKRQLRDEINKNIATVNQSITTVNALSKSRKFPGEQRAEISGLVVNYQARVTSLRSSLEAKTPGQSDAFSSVGTTPDATSTAQLLTVIDRAMKKKDPTKEPPPTELERAEAIQSALSEFELWGIENEENSKTVFTFVHRHPDKIDIDKTAIEAKVNSLVDSQKMRAEILLRRPPSTVTRTTAFSNPNQ